MNRHLNRRFFAKAAMMCISVALMLAWSGTIFAQGTYSAFFSSPSDPRYNYFFRYDTLDQIVSAMNTDPPQNNLENLNPNTSQVNVYSNYAGVALDIAVPSNSNDITLTIPAYGYTKTFTGATRSAALNDFQVWAVSDPDGVISQLEKQKLSISSGTVAGSSGGCLISILH